MPLCGFNIKMVRGIATFSEGLFEATLGRAREEHIEIEEAFKREITDIGLLLEALEKKYQELKGQYTTKEAMIRLVQTMDDRA